GRIKELENRPGLVPQALRFRIAAPAIFLHFLYALVTAAAGAVPVVHLSVGHGQDETGAGGQGGGRVQSAGQWGGARGDPSRQKGPAVRVYGSGSSLPFGVGRTGMRGNAAASSRRRKAFSASDSRPDT